MPLPKIDFRAALNDAQYAAVTAEPGPALVLAGAGSGKTRTLTYRVAFLLSQGVQPDEILLLTFTNKAAREMLDRVSDLTARERPIHWGGTFHSVGGRLLRQYGSTVGLQPNYTILDEGDAEGLLTQVIKDHDKAFLKSKENPKAKVIGNLISLSRNTQQAVIELARERYPFDNHLPGLLDQFARLYEAKKRELQVTDYDDLLTLWLQLLKSQADVRAHLHQRFQYILVDEYQDTNALQSDIIDLMAVDHNIMAVGDDAQCIYSWRGADFTNIARFPERHPDTTIYKIEINYRSTPEILGFANQVLRDRQVDAAFDKTLQAAKPSGLPPNVVEVLDTRHQGSFLVQAIESLVRYEGYSLSDIAILYRAHYQAMDAQLELQRAMIPFSITSGVRFFEQAHIKDVVAQLRFVCNPGDLPAFIRFTTLLPKIGPAKAQSIYELASKLAQKEGLTRCQALLDERVLKKIPSESQDIWPSLAHGLWEIERGLGSRNPTEQEAPQPDLFSQSQHEEEQDEQITPDEAVERIAEGWYADYLKTEYTNGDNRKEDLQALAQFASRYDTLETFLGQVTLMTSETSNHGIELDEGAVRMTTIHQAKGLEYPVVFVIGLSDGLFPLKRALDDGDLEEELRLFYVAVTRAEQKLYLVYPTLMSQKGGSILRLQMSQFIYSIPPNFYNLHRATTAFR